MEEYLSSFVWDNEKERVTIAKHGIDFVTAAKVFKDAKRKIYTDTRHSQREDRLFCIGKVDGKIVTVRFMYRAEKIRIFGAGYWRKGRGFYETD